MSVTFTPAEQISGHTHFSLTFPSTDGHTTCVGDLVEPEGTPRGIVQICHGMVEHISCYRQVAIDLADRGYVVCGIDQLGHGRTTPGEAERGVYDHKEGANDLVEDQHLLRQGVSGRYPGVPYVVLGHSMGSFIIRCYVGRHGEGLAGAIILGTAWQGGGLIGATKFLTGFIALFHGWDYRSPFVNNLGVGGYNKEFEGTGAKTGYEWLSRDEARPVAYAADPDCGWVFSLSGYRTLANLLTESEDPKAIARVPEKLPILVLSGANDPVGSKGEGPAHAFRAFKEAGVEDVTLDLFDGARHELLNETCRAEVLAAICEWLGRVCQSQA